MKTRTTIRAVLTGMALHITGMVVAEEVQLTAPSEANPSIVTQEISTTPSGDVTTNQGPAKLSSGLEDIVRMVQSGASTEVILSFVENSPIAYSPGADDVIQLHKSGMPSPVIIALLRHGEKMREQQLQAAQLNRVPATTVSEWYSNSSSAPTGTNSSVFVNSTIPVYTYTYPDWWFAYYPGFWFGYLWPYYNCGFVPRNSWCYVAPANSRYPNGSWGSYSRTVIEPRAGWNYAPRPIPSYVARPASPPVAMPRVNYSVSAPPARGGGTPPVSLPPRGRGR